MKTIRLLYPDYVSGGLDTYYFGANLLQHILPANPNQPVVPVDITPPDGRGKSVINGIYGENEVLAGIRSAQDKLAQEQPDRVITIGGNCMVSLAPFDYLHGRYSNVGIIWIDAHPDVSTVDDGYPNAHSMVLGSLLGHGAAQLREQIKNGLFAPDQIMYIGLQPVLDYQERYLNELGVQYAIQDKEFVGGEDVIAFVNRFDHVLVHLDIDVMDERLFHSTYFANPELTGDGSSGGKMTMEQLGDYLHVIETNADMVGFTIAEYLPFDEHKLHNMFTGVSLLTGE